MWLLIPASMHPPECDADSASALQVTPSSPVHQGAPMGLAQKRLMREAEPANSGHSGHTPKAQQMQDMLDINTPSAWEQQHRQVSACAPACLG